LLEPDEGETAAALPSELSAALAQAEGVLAAHDKLASVLRQTGIAIAESLGLENSLYRQLGAAEIGDGDEDRLRAELTDVRDRRDGEVRRRRAAAEALLDLSDDLRAVREQATKAQAEFTSAVMADFQSRWRRACSELAVLDAEARQLSAALRCPVTCGPPPYVAAMNAVTSRCEVRFVGEPVEPPPMSAPVRSVTGTLDRLDRAATLIAAIRQSAEQDQRHRSLALIRAGMPDQMTGTYTTVRQFDHLGVQYTPGMLVNREIIHDAGLYRLQLARAIRLADPGAAVAVA
jgi:hypothetical protein